MKKLAFISILMLLSFSLFAQNAKKTLTFDDIVKWNRITEKMISNDGNTVVYKAEPWQGDPVLFITNKKGEEIAQVACGERAKITSDSKFVVFQIKTDEETVRQLKLKKTKKDKMPLNKLGIYNLETKSLDTISELKNFKVADKWAGWIAYQSKTEFEKDTTEKGKPKKETPKDGFALHIKSLSDGNVKSFPFVTDYELAKEKQAITFISTGNKKDFTAGVYYFDLNSENPILIMESKGAYEQLTIKKDASGIAFLADTSSKKKKEKSYGLYFWNGTSVAEILNNENAAIPAGWEISKNGNLEFAKTTNRIYFGTAPIAPIEDTTVLEEDIPVVDIWHWNEPTMHTQQLVSKSRDLRKSYLAVYHMDKKEMVQLYNQTYTGYDLINFGDADKVFAWSNLPYAVQIMWEGYPTHNDFYLIDIHTGKAEMIKKDCRANAQASPGGKYLYWYQAMDTSWNTYNLAAGKEFKLTTAKTIQIADELNDIPNPPRDYGNAGWTKNDETFIIYDRYDIWKLDPENNTAPVNLTSNGKDTKTNYRLIDFNRFGRRYLEDDRSLDVDKKWFVEGHNEVSREDAFYSFNLKQVNAPKKLYGGAYSLSTPFKAKNEEVYVFTQENFQTFPNLVVTDKNFKKTKKISNLNPQQDEFAWGTIELYSWTSLDGKELQGLLAKPANFDPNKKYPMIVNFYEKSSQGLFGHRIPEAHRSTVDYHYYTSNGYIVFNPDVYYKEGYPGEDAFNCVMPGVTALIGEGFVDKDKIGAQGHSWGGYQVAYMATRTNLFAAIESGAPVVNMFSAYGGIRLTSGMIRSFQYEHTQSRIGKSIWESPLRYLESSPLFTADKINTPMLIMANQKDGAVPVSQGVEFFVALRRMGKEAWLLNYNEGDHWPLLVRDKKDFQIRLAQYFDHYLKGAPMPKWMKEGVPAVNKGNDLGYELEQ